MDNNKEFDPRDKNKDGKVSYKEEHGTTRVGDFLRKIGGVAPEILDVAGKLTGIKQLETLGELIDKDESMSIQHKEIALQKLQLDIMELQMRQVKEQEVTKRWEADAKSDSWLSKNIRPITLAYLLLSTTVILILDSALDDFKVEEYWVTLLGSLTITALGGYFALREIGKYIGKREETKRIVNE